jgi:hypothetical protein
MSKGLIVNVSDSRYDCEVERVQPPVLTLEDGTPVFEVWFYHWVLKRWFVMSYIYDQRMIAQGIVYFQPGNVEGLKRTMYSMGDYEAYNRKPA